MNAVSLGTAPERAALQRVRHRTLRDRLKDAVIRIHARLSEWRQFRRDRAELARFDERMLSDIGLTRGDVWREINQPFWRK